MRRCLLRWALAGLRIGLHLVPGLPAVRTAVTSPPGCLWLKAAAAPPLLLIVGGREGRWGHAQGPEPGWYPAEPHGHFMSRTWAHGETERWATGTWGPPWVTSSPGPSFEAVAEKGACGANGCPRPLPAAPSPAAWRGDGAGSMCWCHRPAHRAAYSTGLVTPSLVPAETRTEALQETGSGWNRGQQSGCGREHSSTG